MTDRFHVIIAGGKTGGHLFPGIAVAQALKRKQPTTQIRFVGTNAPFETQTVKTYGFDHLSIFSRPLKGRSLVQKLTGTAAILVSLAQSFWILWRFSRILFSVWEDIPHLPWFWPPGYFGFPPPFRSRTHFLASPTACSHASAPPFSRRLNPPGDSVKTLKPW